MNLKYARRRSRKGKGVLPPNPNQWNNEHNALDLREELQQGLGTPLLCEEAFSLLNKMTVEILPHGKLPIADKYIQHFRQEGGSSWSGFSLPLPDDQVVVVYNDSHSPNRIRSTLMEEFFHLWLGHPPTILRAYHQKGVYRSYKEENEKEAYDSGAAALLPYHSLREMLFQNKTVADIAGCFEVSTDLVIYRMKVTKLYNRYLSCI